MTEPTKPSVPDVVKRTVVAWGENAHTDLSDARILLGSGSCRNVAFLAQQCAEKSLKGVLILHQREYPYTHNIAEILTHIVEIDHSLADTCSTASKLIAYAVRTRYARVQTVTFENAKEALSIAGDVYARAKAYVAAFGVIWP